MPYQKTQIAFFGVLTLCFILGGISRYTVSAENNPKAENGGSIENGKNLAFNICGQCHYNDSLGRFIGKPMSELPGFLGKIFSANLTHSASYSRFVKYSDAELIILLKTGTSRDGRYIPFMIRPNLADSDINDIILYFRSGDSAVAATDKVAGKTDETLLGKTATKLSGKPLPFKKGVVRPDENNPVSYGKYLVDNLACYHCHSKGALGLDYSDPENSKGYMQGGLKFKTPAGNKVYAANLTPDKQTGIGNFTKEDFRKALIKGLRPSGKQLQFPMQKFVHLTNKQADAIFAYLQTLKPVKNKIKR